MSFHSPLGLTRHHTLECLTNDPIATPVLRNLTKKSCPISMTPQLQARKRIGNHVFPVIVSVLRWRTPNGKTTIAREARQTKGHQ